MLTFMIPLQCSESAVLQLSRQNWGFLDKVANEMIKDTSSMPESYRVA